MANDQNILEGLVEKAEEFGKTSFELFKLKTVDKTADVLSETISRLLIVVVLVFFISMLNTGIALLIGEFLPRIWYGFMIVAGFYGIVSFILYLMRNRIKQRLGDSFIRKILN